MTQMRFITFSNASNHQGILNYRLLMVEGRVYRVLRGTYRTCMIWPRGYYFQPQGSVFDSLAPPKNNLKSMDHLDIIAHKLLLHNINENFRDPI